LHFSYIPPVESSNGKAGDDAEGEEAGLGAISGLPEVLDPKLGASPGKLFLGVLKDSAEKNGGWPSWLGGWWARRWEGRGGVPGHTLYSPGSEIGVVRNITRGGGESEKKHIKTGDLSESVVKGGIGIGGIQAAAGNGRVWVVRGRQWTEVRMALCTLIVRADRGVGYESLSFESASGGV
jgi:hypothetical protein